MDPFPVARERIERRARFFLEIAQEQVATPLFKSAGITFDNASAMILSEAYFMMTETYRTYRNEPGHRIAKPKIAAITCGTICAMGVLRPPKGSTAAQNFSVLEIRYANPMYAMRCASSAIEHPYHMRSFDERRRIYDDLSITRFPCLKPFIDDVEAGRKKDLAEYNTSTKPGRFSLKISRVEFTKVESFVSMFVVYQQQKIYAAVNNMKSRWAGP